MFQQLNFNSNSNYVCNKRIIMIKMEIYAVQLQIEDV